jgi:hypothetical protein
MISNCGFGFWKATKYLGIQEHFLAVFFFFSKYQGSYVDSYLLNVPVMHIHIGFIGILVSFFLSSVHQKFRHPVPIDNGKE